MAWSMGAIAILSLAVVGCIETLEVEVDVQPNGSGDGRVVSHDAHVSIDCLLRGATVSGPKCFASFEDEGGVGSFALGATPESGHRLVGWQCATNSPTTGDCSQCQGDEQLCQLAFGDSSGADVLEFRIHARFEPEPATPGVCPSAEASLATFEDDFNDNALPTARWSTALYFTDGAFGNMVSHPSTEGNGGGYRRMTHTLGLPAGPSGLSYIWVAHFYTTTYSPADSGAISKLLYSEDRVTFTSTSLEIGSKFVVRQGGVIYVAELGSGAFNNMTWARTAAHEFTAESFGPNGPDFTETGGPIEFGYMRHNSTSLNPTSGFETQHGIDNWEVVVCP